MNLSIILLDNSASIEYSRLALDHFFLYVNFCSLLDSMCNNHPIDTKKHNLTEMHEVQVLILI